MKILLDFLPLAFFFLVYKIAGIHPDASAAFATHWLGAIVSGGVIGAKEAPILLATVVMVIATLAQAITMKIQGRRIDLILWINLTLMVVLGGIAVYLHNEVFIKWKPSIMFWLLSLIFWVSNAFFDRNLLRQTLGAEMQLPDRVWQRLNTAWASFFGAMGLLNVWVVYTFSTDGWAKFHTFYSSGLTVLFMIGMVAYLSKHLEPLPSGDDSAN